MGFKILFYMLLPFNSHDSLGKYCCMVPILQMRRPSLHEIRWFFSLPNYTTLMDELCLFNSCPLRSWKTAVILICLQLCPQKVWLFVFSSMSFIPPTLMLMPNFKQCLLLKNSNQKHKENSVINPHVIITQLQQRSGQGRVISPTPHTAPTLKQIPVIFQCASLRT